jgi:hypothetical protein
VLKYTPRFLSGAQICIEAALQAGCRYFYATPSPSQAGLLNEGAWRMREAHGTFIQAESPAAALAMAMGSAAAGGYPIVSASSHDYLAMLEALSYAQHQALPLLILLVLDSPWDNHGAAQRLVSLPVNLPCWVPDSLGSLPLLLRQALQALRQQPGPAILALDPWVLQAQSTLLPENTPGLSSSALRLHQPPQAQRRWLAVGAAAGWLVEQAPPDWAIASLQQFWPLPLANLTAFAAGDSISVLEWGSPALSRYLQPHCPFPLEAVVLPQPEGWVDNVAQMLRQRCEAQL